MRSILSFVFAAPVATALAQKDWPTTGHDIAGTRYSTLKQIDVSNVAKLQRDWTYHMNTAAPAEIAGLLGINEKQPARLWIIAHSTANLRSSINPERTPWSRCR